MTKKSFLVLTCLMLLGLGAKAQGSDVQGHTGQNLDYNVISTAVPFMIIAPDARSAGMGDVGVSTSPDVFSMHWNPAKYAFIKEDFDIGLAYSPWLRKLVPDMNIAYLGASKRMSNMSTVAASSTRTATLSTAMTLLFAPRCGSLSTAKSGVCVYLCT